MRSSPTSLKPSDLRTARALLERDPPASPGDAKPGRVAIGDLPPAAPKAPGGKLAFDADVRGQALDQAVAPKARGGKPAFDADLRTKALDQLEALALAHDEVQPLDVESAARASSRQAAQSLRQMHEAVVALKRSGRLVDVEAADRMSPELLVRLQERNLPARVQRHVFGLATQDLHRLLAHPSKNRVLRNLLQRRARSYGVRPGALKANLPPPKLPLKDRNARQTTALLGLLYDPKLPQDLKLACIEALGRVGDSSATKRLASFAARGGSAEIREAASAALAQIQKAQKMTIVFASMEVRPYAGTGGLGNVMKELPRALAQMGHRVVVITPRHTTIDRDTLEDTGITGHIHSPIAEEPFQILHDHADGVDHYFVENDKYFSAGRNGLYGDEHGDFKDPAERYDFFSAAIPQVIQKVLGDDAPDVVQLNDAHTGPAAAYISGQDYFADTKTIMAIHNLGAAYQGRFAGQTRDRMMIRDMGLDGPGAPAEFHGDVNLLKLGLAMSDAAITVSRTYKDEILTDEHGEGLQGVLRHLDANDRLFGNLNGIDNKVWDPAADPLLPVNFSFHDLEGKAACKAALQERFGLPAEPDVPVVGVVARLAHQKGWDDVIAAIEHAAATGKKVQFALCGQGDKAIAAKLASLAERHPKMVAFDEAFTPAKEHHIYGGSDLFLMPSLFEPCGLPQMYALRYLTVPIVRAVGGLEESVQAYEPRKASGNGFKFTDDVAGALDRAVAWYQSGDEARTSLLRNCALSDFSWQTNSAVEQVAVFREVIGG